MRKENYWGLLILAVVIWGFPAFAANQGKAPPQAAPAAPTAGKAAAPESAKVPAPTPNPKQILQQMADFLKQQQ